MSDQTDALDWDEVLGEVEKFEKDPDNKDKIKGGGDFEALPKGPYNVVVQEATKQTAASSGNDMIKVKVQVIEGPYANRTLFSYIVFSKGSPNGMRLTFQKLEAFGITRDYIAKEKPSIPAIADMLEGLQAVAQVDIQDSGEYKGRNEVKGFRPLAGAPAPVASAPVAAGVPNIPTPSVPDVAAPTPSVPVPQVPTATDAPADPFQG